jgi:hypothetical protein
MKPIKFKGWNKELQKPLSMTNEHCSSLPVFTDGEICVSCWTATLSERIKFLFNNRLWIRVRSGESQPPIALGFSSPFYKEFMK